MATKAASTFDLAMMAIVIALIVGCVVLYYFNPCELKWLPKCPFLALTGFKCPGCGTLRGIHRLLHLRIADAWEVNPFMIVALPLMGVLLAMPKLAKSVLVCAIVTVATIIYWIIRNIIDI